MGKRISGKTFDTKLGDLMLKVDKINLQIADNTQAASNGGVPNGWTEGDVSADGDIEVDWANFLIMHAAAKQAGSYRAIPPMDFSFAGNSGDEECAIDAFGCKIMVNDLLAIDPTSKDKSLVKLKFIVTDPNFIHINGVPYLDPKEIEGLI